MDYYVSSRLLVNISILVVVDFLLCSGLAPLTPFLFRDQLNRIDPQESRDKSESLRRISAGSHQAKLSFLLWINESFFPEEQGITPTLAY